MSEEFQESDVIFSDHFTNSDEDSLLVFPEIPPLHNNHNATKHNIITNNNESRRRSRKMTTTTKSSPVPVPTNVPASVFRFPDYDTIDDDGGEITPPHVIIGRRLEGKTAFSVCTGNGRTLKGRDLSRLRNSVLRMTGFLEV